MELHNLLKENSSSSLTTYVQRYIHVFHTMYEWYWVNYLHLCPTYGK